MKNTIRKYRIIVLFVFLPVLSYSLSEYFTFGIFPSSFFSNSFSGYMNPNSDKDLYSPTLRFGFGAFTEQDYSLSFGFPTSIGSFIFNFTYLDYLSSKIGRIGYTQEIAENLFFGFNIKGGVAKNFIFGFDTGLNYIGNDFEIAGSINNIGLSSVDGEPFFPIGLRLEAKKVFSFIEYGKTNIFAGLFSSFSPFGNTLIVGFSQDFYFTHIGIGTGFDVNGDNYKVLGPLFANIGVSKRFKDFSLSFDYYVYPFSEFNNKKDAKHIFDLSIGFGSEDKRPPQIDIEFYTLLEKDNVIYISPNGDGIKDELEFGLNLEDESMIQEWAFIVRDKNGDIVYNRGSSITKDKPSLKAFNNILAKKKSVFYPTNVIWPAIDNDNKKLPDGTYTFEVMAKDFKGNFISYGNQYTKMPQKVVIDTLPPSVKIKTQYTSFSPNKDGIKDDITIEHLDASNDSFWTLSIKASDHVVYKKFFEKLPLSFKWDGTNEEGKVLPDGEYLYVLEGVDRAGNTFTVSQKIVIDTKIPTLIASIGDNYFSPNGDGIKDYVVIDQKIDKKGIWKGIIRNENGNDVYSKDWKGVLPPSFKWDGKDKDGRVLPDGKYKYMIDGEDDAGNKISQTVATLIIDNTPPSANINVLNPIFSPNNDGINDSLNIFVSDATSEDYWIMDVLKDNKVIHSFYWDNIPPKNIVWSGKVFDTPLPDGKYTLVLRSQDKAGNSFKIEKDIVIDNTPPILSVNIKDKVFSPNNDGVKDTIEISINTNADTLSFTVLDNNSNPVIQKNLDPKVGIFVWDGDKQKDGNYRIIFEARDKAGNTSLVSDFVTILRISDPLSLSGDKRIINPLNNKYSTINFDYTLPSMEFVEKVDFSIYKGSTEVYKKTFISKNINNKVIYNGEGDYGVLEDGEYRVLITAYYKNGDVLKSNYYDFIVDTKGPLVSLNIGPEIFSPDGDGEDDVLYIDLDAKDVSGIKEWKIVIEDRFSDSFKTFKGQKPGVIIWDGVSDSGELTASAEDYKIYAEVVDNVGNVTVTPKKPFTVDILVIKTSRGYQIRISNIEFDFNKADLKPQAFPVLNKLAEKLKKFPDYRIKIEGHADSIGREEWNEKLSLMRANSVRDYLVKEKGLPLNMFETEGLGSRVPIFPNDTTKNRAKNRRVEFLLIKKR